MRLIFALPLLALGACQVTKDDKNDQTTIEYNQDVAENGISDAANTAEDLGNAAEGLGSAIANEAEATAGKVQNEVGDVDVDVNVTRNKSDEHTTNHQ